MDTEKPTATSAASGQPPVPFEDLPLAERVKIVDALPLLRGLAPGWLVDAKDTVNNWCVAEVLKVDGNDVALGYDGWSSKYDDVSSGL